MIIWDDVLIRGLWECHNDTIIDVRFENYDCANYDMEPTRRLFTQWEKKKSIIMASTVTINIRHFICLLYLLMGCLGKRPRSYLSN